MQEGDLLTWTKVKEDDSKAFEIIFNKYYPALCLLSERYTRDMTTSREIVQDLFIQLWENRKSLTVSSSLRSYLATAVRFNSIRRIRSDQRVLLITDTLPEISQELNDHLEYAELQAAIIKAIESLPFQCRRVFEMSRFKDLKYSEIASELKLSVKTVEAHISKALRLIQKEIEMLSVLIMTILAGIL